ncbi:MAG: type II toxin-antitoxin system VapC family toxin [Desulfotomaculales bacterium]
MDTDFLIDLNRGRRNSLRARAEKLLLEINQEDLFISSVAVTEFMTGIPQPVREQAEKMLRELYFYLAPTFEEASLAGRLRQEWLSRGYNPAFADVTNAALAISRNLVLVTRNLSHYPFEGLKIKGW